MQQNTPQVNPTVATLTDRIEKAKREHADLYQLQAIEPTPKREHRMQVILDNLSDLKTLRLRYLTEQRYIRVYRNALDTRLWQGKVIGEVERANLEKWIASCEAEIAEIEAEVNP